MRSTARLSATLALLLITPTALLAQRGTVRGTVKTAAGAPIAGAAVLVQGTTEGTLVASDGTYALPVDPGTYKLEARALGYKTVVKSVTVAAGATETVDFSLQVTAIELGEVVATVEAGQVKRRQLGTDVSSLDVAAAMPHAAVTSVSDLLNGRVEGVKITQASGNVGAGSRIRVRGINSLTQGNNPLIIIDGVRASNNTNVGISRGQTFSRFNDLDPNNIANIQVVKGPAALALYGSDAGSGVIIITTKTGQNASSGMNVTVQLQQGAIKDVTKYPDNLADVTDFVAGADDPKLNGFRVETNPLTKQVFVVDNPFEDASTSPFRTGRMSNASVQLTGRGDKVSYFTSLAYDNNTGVLPSNDLKRLNFRANFQATPTDKLSITASSGYINSKTNLPKGGNNTSGFFLNALRGSPLSSTNDAGVCLATVLEGNDPSFCDKDGNIRAAFPKIAAIISREDLERFTGSLRLRYTPFPWLVGSATLGTDVVDQVFNDAIPYDPDVPFSFAAGGEYFRTRNLLRHNSVNLAATASYGLTDGISASTGVGAQYFQRLTKQIACEGRVFVNAQANACDAAVSLRGFSDLSENVELGAFLQQRVSYHNYFFVTGAARVDDNSALGADEPAIWSPSFNTSLVLSDMPMWHVDPGIVSDLRLRAAWGTASNSPQQYAAERTYGIVRLSGPNGTVPGLSPEAPGNEKLGPERSSEIEGGFDASILNSRVGLAFTYYHRVTRDAIVSRPIAPSTGFAQSQFVNLGKLENHGLEASVHAQLVTRDNLNWQARLTMSTTHAKILDLGDQNGFGGFRVGYAPASLVSCVITAAERDADGNIIPSSIVHAEGTLNPGDKDDCRRVVGQETPTNEESLNTTITLFHNFRVSALFDRVAGNLIYSGTLDQREPGSLNPASSTFGRMWAFRQTETTPIEQAEMEADYNVGDHNIAWEKPGDFIKFRELKVAYTLPQNAAARFGMSNATIYVGARNLHTWTDYPGLDPEINQGGARDQIGITEGNALPPARIIFSGIRVTF